MVLAASFTSISESKLDVSSKCVNDNCKRSQMVFDIHIFMPFLTVLN